MKSYQENIAIAAAAAAVLSVQLEICGHDNYGDEHYLRRAEQIAATCFHEDEKALCGTGWVGEDCGRSRYFRFKLFGHRSWHTSGASRDVSHKSKIVILLY